jgi:large conductance mechanosensitive channel protein
MPHNGKANQKSQTSAQSTAAQDKPAALKQTIMTPDGQVVQITTKPAPTPRGMPNLPVNARTRRRHKQSIAALVNSDNVVSQQVGGFVSFIREHAIVGLAVGFIIGTQAQSVIKQLVSSFIDPLIHLFLGGADLDKLKATVHLFGTSADFTYGAMIFALINLLAVLIAIYALIKAFKLDKLDKPKA